MLGYQNPRWYSFSKPLWWTFGTVRYFGLGALGLGLMACQPAPESATDASPAVPPKPEVIVAQTPASIPPAKVGLKRMDFPVFLSGVPSLLHPVIPSVPMTKKSDNYDEASRNTDVSYFQEIGPYEFQSSIYNLVFETIRTGEIHRLFPQDNFVIKAVHTPFITLSQNDKTAQPKAALKQQPTPIPKNALKSTEVKVNDTLLLGYFIYEVKETADDEDEKTNLDQQLSLYMSDLTGKNLIKLTPNNQYFKHYQWLPETKRFYFSTQADTNGDHSIDENDKYFYYFIDFSKNPQLVTAYDFSKPKP